MSKDLINWEYIGFSVPRLDFNSPAYNLQDGLRAYARGVWASTLRYRSSNDL
jgi:beta-xylosidase